MIKSGRITAALLASAAFTLPTTAFGQDTEVSSGAVEDIVVTAQRREERLQDVPVSVTALSGDTLKSQRIINASDLASVTPNLQSVSTVGSSTPIFALRGISMSDYSLNQASPVATYFDEVYKGNFALLGVSLFDLERVEVLRGPQGTLYGKNTTGGAVNLIAKRPSFEPEASLSAGYGNFNRYEATGALQMPLNDTLAARLAFTYANANGDLRNLSAGQGDLGAVDEYGMRLSFLLQPSDSAEFILRLSTSLQNSANYGIIAEPGPDGIGAGVYATFRAIDPKLNPRTDDFRTGLNRRELTSDFTPQRRNRTYAAALTSKFDLSDSLSVISVSSYDHGTLLNEEDTDGSALAALSILYEGRASQVTQDVRLVSGGDGPMAFTLGGFFGSERVFNATNLRVYQDVDFNLDGALDFQDCLTAGPPAGCQTQNSFNQNRTSWAIYTDGRYDLGSGFALRAGARFSHDTGRQYDIISQMIGSDDVVLANLIPGDANNVDATTSQKFSKSNVSGKIGLDYSFDDNLLYLSYSRGYRASSFAAQAFFTPDELTVARPETVDSIEGGFKLDLLDRRLRVNGALFHYSYRDQQFIDVNPDGTQRLLNLPRSRILGGEIELTARPIQALTVNAGLGWLDSQIKEGIVQGVSVSGNQLPNAPRVSLSYGADWTIKESDWGKLSLNVNGSLVGAQYFDTQNNPELRQNSYNTIGARLGVRSTNDQFGIAFWGKNLTDEYYFTSRVAVTSFGFNYNHVGAPRTYGVTIDAKF